MDKKEIVLDGLTKCELYGQTLQRCLEQECPYVEQRGKTGECVHFLHEDAVELLKEREPRVLTLKEVLSQSWDYCYIEAEVRPHSKMIETLCGIHRLYCTTSIVLERQTRGDKEYGKTWRCWTARPTDEQRKAVKWDD